jgi:hypothetical protein
MPAQLRLFLATPLATTLLSKRHLGMTLLLWVPCALVITLLCFLVAGAVQHDIRIGANDPQIQLAEDAAAALSSGAAPQTVLPSQSVDISRSLAPYLIVFDAQGQIVASSATLHGTPPVLPSGVFPDVLRQGELRFTWQPEPGVRQAVVITRATGTPAGFVLAGRSLREIEQRESDLNVEVVAAWGVSLVSTVLALWAVSALLGLYTLRRS